MVHVVPTTNRFYAIVKDHGKCYVSVASASHGGGERVRTDDLLRARQALSQLSYTPDKLGGPRRTRTSDLTIISRVL